MAVEVNIGDPVKPNTDRVVVGKLKTPRGTHH